MKELKLFFLYYLVMAFFSCSFLFANSSNDEYKRAISLAREGYYAESVKILKDLMSNSPENINYKRDYIVVCAWKGDYKTVILEYKKIRNQNHPLFFLLQVANAYRHLKDYKKALSLYEEILYKDRNNSLALEGKATCFIDQRKIVKAKEIIESLLIKDKNNVNLLKKMANIYAVEKKYFDEMFCYQKILEINPVLKDVQRNYVLTMSKQGMPKMAKEYYKKYKLKDNVLEGLIAGDYAVQGVRWALLNSEFEAHKYMEADRALNLLQEIKNNSAYPLDMINRAVFDTIPVLALKKEMNGILEIQEKISKKKVQLPNYAQKYIGDALVSLKKPQKSIPYYDSALKYNPYDYSTEISRAYGYLESEEILTAKKKLEALSKREPIWLQILGPKVRGSNAARFNADFTKIMFQAYSGRLKKSLRNIKKMLYKGPYNKEIRTAYAKLSLWAGDVSFALKEFNKVLSYKPDFLGAKIYKNYCLMKKRDYKVAAKNVAGLYEKFGENLGVQKLKRDWETDNSWQLHSEAIFGRGEGRVLGNKEFKIDSTFYSSRLFNKYRFFIHHFDSWAKFKANNIRYSRVGVGMNYEYKAFMAEAEILKTLDKKNDFGYRMKIGFRVNDYFYFDTQYFNNAIDVPLRGRKHGLIGDKISLNIHCVPYSKDKISLGYNHYIYSDQNIKRVLNFDYKKNIFDISTLGMNLAGYIYTSSSKLRDVYYYSPEKDFSFFLESDMWHVLKRSYDFKYVHRFFLGYGYYWQKRWNWNNQWLIKYQHELDTSDRFAILFGVSYSKKYYDGYSEKSFTSYITLNWRF